MTRRYRGVSGKTKTLPTSPLVNQLGMELDKAVDSRMEKVNEQLVPDIGFFLEHAFNIATLRKWTYFPDETLSPEEVEKRLQDISKRIDFDENERIGENLGFDQEKRTAIAQMVYLRTQTKKEIDEWIAKIERALVAIEKALART